MPHDEERELRDFLSAAHRILDPEPPGFEATWGAARRPRKQGPRWQVATAMAALVVAVVGLGLFFRGRPPELDPAEALRLAESLSAWQGPTDFLGRQPGGDLLSTLPRLGSTTSWTMSSTLAMALAEDEKEEIP